MKKNLTHKIYFLTWLQELSIQNFLMYNKKHFLSYKKMPAKADFWCQGYFEVTFLTEDDLKLFKEKKTPGAVQVKQKKYSHRREVAA